MKFSALTGNPRLAAALAGMVDSGRIPHAILFHEDDGGGGVGIAIAFLQYLYCQTRQAGDSCGECPSCNKVSKLIHPDIHFIFPVTAGNTARNFIKEWRELVLGNPSFTEEDLNEALGISGKAVTIAVPQAKELLDTLSLSALEGGYRSVVIYLPEKMNAEAANRLLKIIEEPPHKTQFVMVTHAPEKVLQTIQSRCQRIRVLPEKTKRKSLREDYPALMSELMESLLSKDLLSALDAGDKIAALPSRDSVKAFCKFAADSLRNVFLLQQGLEILAPAATGLEVNWASRCRKSFPREALALFSQANRMIDRNVNQKIVFADTVGKLFTKI